MTLATIGAQALYLLFAWLIITIICQYLAERKGYGTRWGLATGLIFPPGVLVWLVMRAKPESNWVATRTRFDLFLDRLGAYLLDAVIIGIPSLLIALIVGPVVGAIVFGVAAAIYFVVMEGGSSGQTVGKMALNVRLVDRESGEPGIGYGRALVRHLMRYVSSAPLELGYLWMLWDDRSQTWHDKVSGSQVRPLVGEMPSTAVRPANPLDDLSPAAPAS